MSRTHDWPSWLVEIAVVIDEWVSDPQVFQRFREMLAQWKKDLYLVSEPRLRALRAGKRLPKKYDPLELLPSDLAPTLAQKYAALAVIHDCVCKRAKRLDLWKSQKHHWHHRRIMAGAAYNDVLSYRVTELLDKDRDRVEKALAVVARDLRKKPPVIRRPTEPAQHEVHVQVHGAVQHRHLHEAVEEPKGKAKKVGSEAAGADKPDLQIMAEITGLSLPDAAAFWLERNPKATVEDLERVSGKKKSTFYQQRGPWARVRLMLLKSAASGSVGPGIITKDREHGATIDGVHRDKEPE